MAEVYALTRKAGRNQELQPGDALQGTAGVIDLIGYQGGSGLVSGLLGADTTLAGSDFLWDARFLPQGRSIYFETVSSGSVLTTQNTVALYTAAGALVVANTTTGTGAALTRSAAITLVSGTTYQVHFRTAIVGTGTLRLARLIIL